MTGPIRAPIRVSNLPEEVQQALMWLNLEARYKHAWALCGRPADKVATMWQGFVWNCTYSELLELVYTREQIAANPRERALCRFAESMPDTVRLTWEEWDERRRAHLLAEGIVRE